MFIVITSLNRFNTAFIVVRYWSKFHCGIIVKVRCILKIDRFSLLNFLILIYQILSYVFKVFTLAEICLSNFESFVRHVDNCFNWLQSFIINSLFNRLEVLYFSFLDYFVWNPLVDQLVRIAFGDANLVFVCFCLFIGCFVFVLKRNCESENGTFRRTRIHFNGAS